MDALSIFGLAARLHVNMILDDRRDGRGDVNTVERVLGPCYARLVGNPPANARFMNRIVCFISEGCREPYAILILTDVGQAETFAQLATGACADRITVQFIQTDRRVGDTLERIVHGASQSH
jgi:hypothetical protein